MASDICWISASSTPAPIAWTVPASIRMQSPGSGLEAVQQRLDLARVDRLGEFVPADARLQAGVDQAPRLGGEDHPGLGLAVVTGQPPARLVVGVDLDREVLVRVDELDQERELVARPDRRARAAPAPRVPDQLAERRAGQRPVARPR